MKLSRFTATAVLSLCCVPAAFATGAPKPEHPCYEVADCKSQSSREDFSACIKQNKEAADAITACAEFRKDKPAYMEKHGIDGVDSLFEAG